MKEKKIAIIGLGYVGLPLAVEFGKKREVIGFDIDTTRINELKHGKDRTLETGDKQLSQAVYLSFTNNIADIKDCEILIVTVPTPVDKNKKPDLTPLVSATKVAGSILKKQDIVIYESTVYPGTTEEICVPILQETSKLIYNKDFYCGYSPERINPGDKDHRITTIKKITSGSNPVIAKEVDELYQQIILAGTHKVNSIKIAEAAKVIENTQRDLNIALMNELSIIFNKLNIDTEEVLEAAETKWNFLPFRPGLVGGHCIGVDPYYLTHKALEVGYNPEIILSGRRLNDSMASYVGRQVIELMYKKNIEVQNPDILIMGLSFKENCPEIRNTRVIDLVKELSQFNANVEIYDPVVDKDEVLNHFGIKMINYPIKKKYDAVIIAVLHDEFKKFTAQEIKSFCKDKAVLYDIKYLLKASEVDGRL